MILALLYTGSTILGVVIGQPPGQGGPPAGEINRNDPAVIAGMLAVCFGWMVCQVAQLWAGVKMRQLESYSACILGSVLACIPLCNCTLVFAIPAGIWAMIVLLDADVKRAFR